ncbi:energy-coupling factor transporter transmembrane component T family protein [Roseofilum casamattae]|uniref:Energy-coupling factor transporter transmembrane protein EcfT n=1 Tax=Roseofilum casamattae BLCC-M143 TaxID=3022442 RepID=A0ABT7C309_9CYAN|nr:energy-coupling factor transporter transmembrane protein EcfT [Roseofilum casamattae]MDJ1185850.1 energy-coupling factor transporter transmembrane protein EcfT [Roseofilum casamattae BLCC-M143]
MDLLRSLPIGLYLENPVTWLHQLDPRIKLIGLISFLMIPVLATTPFRLLMVALLIAITLTTSIPFRVLKQQLGWLLVMGLLIVLIALIAPDGLAVTHQPRLPLLDTNLPQPTSYRYTLVTLDLKFKTLAITRRSLDLGLRLACLLFTIIYSTALFLLTTAPEEVTAAIEAWMAPLKRWGVPVTEITLTLTLSLRFIALVLEEVQNLVRSVNTRGINWKKLGLKRSARVWLTVVERLLKNLLLRAEQIASAMEVRGFTHPNRHHVEWYQFRWRVGDTLAAIALLGLWIVRIAWGQMS